MSDLSIIEPPVQPAADPMTALAKLIESGGTAEQLDKMTSLVERWRVMNSQDEFNRAMAECQAEMPTIIRTKKNPFLDVNYAPIDDINPLVKPVYAKHGFSLIFSEGDAQQAGKVRTQCQVRHRAGHVETYHVELASDGTGAKGGKNMNATQGDVSSGTYGQRVLLCRIFNLTIANTDFDGQTIADLIDITPEQLSQLETLVTTSGTSRERIIAYAFGLKGNEAEKRQKIADEGLTFQHMNQAQFGRVATQFRLKLKGK